MSGETPQSPPRAATASSECRTLPARQNAPLAGAPRIGDKIRFVPGSNLEKSSGFGDVLGAEGTGTVVQVNEDHRWARCAYETPQGTRYECFKF